MKKILCFILLASLLLSFGCAGNEIETPDTTKADETTEAPETNIPEVKFEMREDQVYAADLWDTSETLSLAFIGGSITSGTVTYPEKLPWWPTCGNIWTNNVISYFVQKYRGEKAIKAENIALPGTNSQYGAARLSEQLKDFNPDILFIEYSMNDMGLNEQEMSLFCEHMIRQCMDLDKIPSIVFVHTVNPHDEATASSYPSWLANVATKDALAEHYGLKTLNVYNTIRAEYDASGTELTFWEFIGPNGQGYFPYNEGSTVHDVHPTTSGQAKISETVITGYETDPEGFFNRPKFVEAFTEGSEEYLNTYFTMIPCTDESITFEGDWTHYTQDNQFTTDDANIAFFPHSYDSHYKFPCCAEGIMQTVAADSSFTFTTSAKSIAVVTVTSQYASSKATVYPVNEDGSLGEAIDNIVDRGGSTGMNQLSSFANLINDGKEHTYKIVVDDPTETNYVFRVGYIIEQFDK